MLTLIGALDTDLDAGAAALGDGVGDGGTRRVNHSHQADEAQARDGEVLLLGVERVVLGELVSIQEEIAESCRNTK